MQSADNAEHWKGFEDREGLSTCVVPLPLPVLFTQGPRRRWTLCSHPAPPRERIGTFPGNCPFSKGRRTLSRIEPVPSSKLCVKYSYSYYLHFTGGKTEGGEVRLAHCGSEMSWLQSLSTLQPTWIVQRITFLGKMACTRKGNAGALAELFCKSHHGCGQLSSGLATGGTLDCWPRLFLRCIWYVIIIT